MSETQKLIAELAARFLVARIQNGSTTGDTAHAYRCVNLAKDIVDSVQKINPK